MEAQWILLLLALAGAAATTAALVHARKPGPPLWRFGGTLASELTVLLGAGMLLALVVISSTTSALQYDEGRLGALLMIVTLAGLAVVHRRVSRTRGVVEAALRTDLGANFDRAIPASRRCLIAARASAREWLQPLPRRPHGVELIADLPYPGGDERNTLDVYRKAAGCTHAPVLLYLHGNEWCRGHKRQQALPLLYRLAELGWVIVAPNYRLSPAARFPAQLVDCKAAFAWIRAHVSRYGGNPHWVAVAGGSAGAHLAALLALTFDSPELQPGFEHVDTRPDACVTCYGVYDFTNRHGLRRDGQSFIRWLSSNIMPCDRARDPAAWEAASPIANVRSDAPPCFVLHGTHDSIVPAREAEVFAARLRAVSRSPVVYAELPGAHHGWDQWRSARTLHSVQAVVRFLEWCSSPAQVTQRQHERG